MNTAQFLAIIFTALALVPSGTHLLEFPSKFNAPQTQYFPTHSIRLGRALPWLVWAVALIADGWLAYVMRGSAAAYVFAFAATLLILSAFGICLLFTQPESAETSNWTEASPDWRAAHASREYTHAANAVLIFVALICVSLSALATRG